MSLAHYIPLFDSLPRSRSGDITVSRCVEARIRFFTYYVRRFDNGVPPLSCTNVRMALVSFLSFMWSTWLAQSRREHEFVGLLITMVGSSLNLVNLDECSRPNSVFDRAMQGGAFFAAQAIERNHNLQDSIVATERLDNCFCDSYNHPTITEALETAQRAASNLNFNMSTICKPQRVMSLTPSHCRYIHVTHAKALLLDVHKNLYHYNRLNDIARAGPCVFVEVTGVEDWWLTQVIRAFYEQHIQVPAGQPEPFVVSPLYSYINTQCLLIMPVADWRFFSSINAAMFISGSRIKNAEVDLPFTGVKTYNNLTAFILYASVVSDGTNTLGLNYLTIHRFMITMHILYGNRGVRYHNITPEHARRVHDIVSFIYTEEVKVTGSMLMPLFLPEQDWGFVPNASILDRTVEATCLALRGALLSIGVPKNMLPARYTSDVLDALTEADQDTFVKRTIVDYTNKSRSGVPMVVFSAHEKNQLMNIMEYTFPNLMTRAQLQTKIASTHNETEKRKLVETKSREQARADVISTLLSFVSFRMNVNTHTMSQALNMSDRSCEEDSKPFEDYVDFGEPNQRTKAQLEKGAWLVSFLLSSLRSKTEDRAGDEIVLFSNDFRLSDKVRSSIVGRTHAGAYGKICSGGGAHLVPGSLIFTPACIHRGGTVTPLLRSLTSIFGGIRDESRMLVAMNNKLQWLETQRNQHFQAQQQQAAADAMLPNLSFDGQFDYGEEDEYPQLHSNDAPASSSNDYDVDDYRPSTPTTTDPLVANSASHAPAPRSPDARDADSPVFHPSEADMVQAAIAQDDLATPLAPPAPVPGVSSSSSSSSDASKYLQDVSAALTQFNAAGRLQQMCSMLGNITAQRPVATHANANAERFCTSPTPTRRPTEVGYSVTQNAYSPSSPVPRSFNATGSVLTDLTPIEGLDL
jgi:hypothetical protein